MGIYEMRQALREANIPGANTLVMNYDGSDNQIYTVTGSDGAQRHFIRSASETSDISMSAIIAELKG